jgi:hypothetical protein
MTQKHIKRLKQRIKNNKKKLIYFLFIFFLIVGLSAIIELFSAYRYFKFRDSLKSEIRTIRLKENLPNLNSHFYQKHLDQTVKLRTNEEGYILPGIDYTEPDLKIVFLGGSTTECMAVDENKRFPYQTGKKLEKSLGLEINTYNTGVSGNNLMHSLNILNNKILKLNPDYLVVMHNINDLSILMHSKTYWNDLESRSLVVHNTDQLFNYYVRYPKNWFVRTFFPYTSLVLFPTMFEGDDPVENEFNENNYKDLKLTDSDFGEIENQYKNAVKTLLLTCKAWNIQPIFMLQPSCFDNFTDHYKHMEEVNLYQYHSKLNQSAREVCSELSIEVIDLDSIMTDNNQLFYDIIHYNEKGCNLISDIISKRITDLEKD